MQGSERAPAGGDRPGSGRLRFDWWLSRAVRLLGFGLIVWELAVDKAKNVLVLLVGATFVNSPDILSVVRRLVRTTKAEDQALEDAIREQERVEREARDRSKGAE